MQFTITYTFSGLKRPGAALAPSPKEPQAIPAALGFKQPVPNEPFLSDWEIETLHSEMMRKKEAMK